MKYVGDFMIKRTQTVKRARFFENMQIYSLLLPLLAMVLIFNYLPMWGIVIGFQDYRAGNSMFALDDSVKWVGLKHFVNFIENRNFTRLIVNTLRLSLLNLAFGFTLPILFAITLNEVRNMAYKRFVQTASYLPYFISAVVVAGMAISFLEPNGIVNRFLGLFGIGPQEYITMPEAYPAIYTTVNVWKSFGFGSILYFSTISSIDPALYESARMDGANRFQQALNITLPGIQYIVAVQLVLQMGAILNTNTDLALLLYRNSTYSTSDVIGTYVYRLGIEGGKYSYTTAVGLFMSLIGFTLTYITNSVSNRLTGYGLW